MHRFVDQEPQPAADIGPEITGQVAAMPSGNARGRAPGPGNALVPDEHSGLLRYVALLAACAVPVAACCVITLNTVPAPVTVAEGTGDSAVLAALRDLTADNPHAEVIRTGRAQHVPELAEEQRWPAFRHSALSYGIHSVLSLPMRGPAGTAGALTLYADRADAYRPGVRARVQALAGIAAESAWRSGGAEPSDGSGSTLAQWVEINQAIGIVMATKRCGADAALTVLIRTSRRHDLNLRDLAARLIHVADRSARTVRPDTGNEHTTAVTDAV